LTTSFFPLVIMARQLSDFLGGYQRGIEVGVAGSSSDEMLGVRDAFRRYFDDLDRPVPVAVVPQEVDGSLRGLAADSTDAIEAARSSARALAARLGATYEFYVGLRACLDPLVESDGDTRLHVRSWAWVIGPPGEASGAGGSLEIPARLAQGLTASDVAAALPMTRRAGGLVATLTGGLESRRSSVELATLNALATLFFGILESRPGRRR
jgi:hypothetical protein